MCVPYSDSFSPYPFFIKSVFPMVKNWIKKINIKNINIILQKGIMVSLGPSESHVIAAASKRMRGPPSERSSSPLRSRLPSHELAVRQYELSRWRRYSTRDGEPETGAQSRGSAKKQRPPHAGAQGNTHEEPQVSELRHSGKVGSP